MSKVLKRPDLNPSLFVRSCRCYEVKVSTVITKQGQAISSLYGALYRFHYLRFTGIYTRKVHSFFMCMCQSTSIDTVAKLSSFALLSTIKFSTSH